MATKTTIINLKNEIYQHLKTRDEEGLPHYVLETRLKEHGIQYARKEFEDIINELLIEDQIRITKILFKEKDELQANRVSVGNVKTIYLRSV